MTKKQIVRKVSDKLKLKQNLVKDVFQHCLEEMIDTIIVEGRLELRNFGVFVIKERAARKARNPKTNKEVFVPAKRVVGFQIGKNIFKKIQP